MPRTLFEKIWDTHEVASGLLYIDLHLVHEVTSPQAFDGLRLAGRRVRRPDRTLATADHRRIRGNEWGRKEPDHDLWPEGRRHLRGGVQDRRGRRSGRFNPEE